MELEARNVPLQWSKDCGIARRCKLFLGRELERGARVQGDLFVGPPMERRNPEVIGSSVGLVPINAFELSRWRGGRCPCYARHVKPQGGAFNCDFRFPLIFLSQAKSIGCQRGKIQFP
jgi:hypothetical protein